MHIIINNYLIDGKNLFYFKDNLEYEQLNLVRLNLNLFQINCHII